jgi:predicted Zn-dependent protease
MVRQKKSAEALDLLGDAVRADPSNGRYTYVYAIVLNDEGQTMTAIETLERIIDTHPYDRDSLAALVSICDQAGKQAESLTYAQRLRELEHQDSSAGSD